MHGNHFHKEQGDGSGSVQGSYGYTDNQGLFRQVDYVADAGGFRASVRTNEPGTDDGKENPADVNLATQPSPQGVQEQYTRPAAYGPVSYGTLFSRIWLKNIKVEATLTDGVCVVKL